MNTPALPPRLARTAFAGATLVALTAGLLAGSAPAIAAAAVPTGGPADHPTAPHRISSLGPDGVAGTDDRATRSTSTSTSTSTKSSRTTSVATQAVGTHQLAGTVFGTDGTGVAATVYAELVTDDGLVDAQQTTTPNGIYSFDGLAAGDYVLVFVADSAAYASEVYQGTNPYRPATVVHVTASSTADGLDAHLKAAGSISGTVSGGWLHPGDFTRNRVTVSLWLLVDGQWKYTGDTRAVNADGSYSFGDLYPDQYLVQAEYYGPFGWSGDYHDSITIAGNADAENFELEQPWKTGGVDFTGDGAADVLARNAAGALVMYRGNGTGGFLAGGAASIGTGWGSFTSLFPVTDFTGEGDSDLIARDSAGALWLYPGNGAGGFSGARTKIGSGWQSFNLVLSPGDFDGDGHDDVIARTSAGQLVLYRGNGHGGFLSGSRVIGSGWQGFTSIIAPGDFDGDGTADLLVRTADGKLRLYGGNGTGGWLGSMQVGSGWQGFNFVGAAGDFDGDQNPDVLARNAAGKLLLYRGNGSGGWLAAKQIGSGWGSLRIVG